MSTLDGPPRFRGGRRASFAFVRHSTEQYIDFGQSGVNCRPQCTHGRGAVEDLRSGTSLMSALLGSVTDERPPMHSMDNGAVPGGFAIRGGIAVEYLIVGLIAWFGASALGAATWSLLYGRVVQDHPLLDSPPRLLG
jgi:hypothetical protein